MRGVKYLAKVAQKLGLITLSFCMEVTFPRESLEVSPDGISDQFHANVHYRRQRITAQSLESLPQFGDLDGDPGLQCPCSPFLAVVDTSRAIAHIKDLALFLCFANKCINFEGDY